MSVPVTIKNRYALNGDVYPSANADRAISDLLACIARLNDEKERADARALNAEGQLAEALTAEKALKDEKERLDGELTELRAANQRLTAEAEKLDKRLASIGVNQTANDKKIAESYERLSALILQAEKLFDNFETRADAIFTELDRRTSAPAAVAAAPAPAADTVPSDNDGAPDADDDRGADMPGEPEDIPETEALENADDTLDESADPNLFGGENETTGDTDTDPEADDIAKTREAIKTAVSTDAAENGESAKAVSDDDIKNMLTAMYSADGADENSAGTEDEKASDTASEYGSMRSSLDAIRRRLGK